MMSGIEREIQIGFKLRVYFTQARLPRGEFVAQGCAVNDEPGEPKRG
jgi:hypothetical protein